MTQQNNLPLVMQAQIDNLQGQVIALRALVLTLAKLDHDVDGLRDEGASSIGAARDALLAHPVSESLLEGVAITEQWLLAATDATGT